MRPVPAPFTHPIAPTIRVAVTGPTKVSEGGLQSATDAILAAITSVAGSARLVVISCLAPGTDQIVAATARERGADVWGIVPSRADSYARRMPDAARGLFHQLTGIASTILELDLPLADGDHADIRAQRQRTYEEANLVMLEHADLLIAAVRPMGGSEASNPAGAPEVVARAFALSIPVALIELGSPPFAWKLLERADPVVFADRLRSAQPGGLLQSLHRAEATPADLITRILHPIVHGT